MKEIAKTENLDEVLPPLVENNEDVIILKEFIAADLCEGVVRDAHGLMRSMPNRQEKDGCFFSFDVLPTKVETDRIFRTLEFLDLNSKHASAATKDLFLKMIDFQKRFIANDKSWDPETQKKRMQIIHYPQGGGFFDWHLHPRLPVNYGLILNLSAQGENFDAGATEIVTSSGKIVKVEDYCNIGDLILFKYDLKHRVAPCDPDKDLCFDSNGRWTAILPIY